MKIRRATAADAAAVLAMAWRFLEQGPYRELVRPSVPHITETITMLLARGVIFVADRGVDVVGMIAGFTSTHPLTGELTATEFAWWVEPEFRGGSAGGRLLRTFEGWARGEGAAVLQMIAPVGEEALAGFYTRRGYDQTETTFQLRLAA